jgi:hypothetical protein
MGRDALGLKCESVDPLKIFGIIRRTAFARIIVLKYCGVLAIC